MVQIEFLAHLMEKLNSVEDTYSSIPEVFAELCDYLSFGCGFYYQVGIDGTFALQKKYAVYQAQELHDHIDLYALLSAEEIEEMKSCKGISFRKNTCDTVLKQKFSKLFSAPTMMLIPLMENGSKLIGFIGIADRRGEARGSDEDMTFGYAILGTIANYLKIEFYQSRVKSTKEALEAMIDNLGIDIYVNDFYTHEILFVNKSMAAPYGGVEAMLGRPCWKALYEGKTQQCEFCPQKKLLDEHGNPTKIYSWDYQRPFDGAWFRVISSTFSWLDGRLAHVVSSVDITENKRNEEIIRKLATHDSLTGLPNRYRLTDDMDAMIPSIEKGEEGYVIFFDLDGFKAVNDKMGHGAGDKVLKHFGNLLQNYALTHNRSYRYGGDEFVILCTGEAAEKIRDILAFIRENFKKPIELDEGIAQCNASIGVSHFPTDDEKTSGLLRKADQTMYISKERGKGMVHFYNRGNPITDTEFFAKKDA